mmetsp:Transcript_18949/g.52848  ORF Transcript_18949/g.52848 Transcript_18949/m.52848 type:complete len:320 (+) Transcript_18949:2204-3163(+)
MVMLQENVGHGNLSAEVVGGVARDDPQQLQGALDVLSRQRQLTVGDCHAYLLGSTLELVQGIVDDFRGLRGVGEAALHGQALRHEQVDRHPLVQQGLAHAATLCGALGPLRAGHWGFDARQPHPALQDLLCLLQALLHDRCLGADDDVLRALLHTEVVTHGRLEGGDSGLWLALNEEDVGDKEVGVTAALVEAEAVSCLALGGLQVAVQVGAAGELHLRLQQPRAVLCQELQGLLALVEVLVRRLSGGARLSADVLDKELGHVQHAARVEIQQEGYAQGAPAQRLHLLLQGGLEKLRARLVVLPALPAQQGPHERQLAR